MKGIGRFSFVRKTAGLGGSARSRRRATNPAVECLEGRQLLTVGQISAIEQYGVPSVVAIDGSGTVFYNFLEQTTTGSSWSGWNDVPGGVDAVEVTTGTITVDAVARPYIFVLNSAGDVFFNFQNSSDNWNGWTQVGASIGATSISSGVIPIANQPYVMAIDSASNVDISSMNADGTWSGWSTAIVNAGAHDISTGVVPVSTAPAVYEPYVFELNSSSQIEYTERTAAGSWSPLSNVGNTIDGEAISALTLGNAPQVFAIGANGSIYSNTGTLVTTTIVTKPATRNAAHETKTVVGDARTGGRALVAVRPGSRVAVRVVEHATRNERARAHAKSPKATTTTSTSVSWSGWSQAGEGSGGVPAAGGSAILAVATNYLFSVSMGQAYSTFGTAGLWSQWTSLSSLPNDATVTSIVGAGPPGGSSLGFSTPTAVGGLPFAFAIGTDGNVYVNEQSSWATWENWVSLGAPS
jgi:hypothetical protein